MVRLTRRNLPGALILLPAVAGAVVRGESMELLGHAGFEAVADGQGRFQTERWRDKMWILFSSAKDSAGLS
jgi:hypothetical protein